MTYTLEKSNQAERFLGRPEKRDFYRIEDGIGALAYNPRPCGSIKLSTTEAKYRIRIGRFRVVYTIDDAQQVVRISRIEDRKNVYKNL